MLRRMVFFLGCLAFVAVIGTLFVRVPSKQLQGERVPHQGELFSGYPKTAVRFGSESFMVFVADTQRRRAQGLSDISSLPENVGMLFQFETPEKHPFWMNRMRFPLDILWVRQGRIVDLWENAPIPQEGDPPASYTPLEDADRVFEFPAGFIAKYEIQRGERVDSASFGPLD